LVYRNVPKFKEYTPKEKNKNIIKIVYAGLLGYAQGILNICKELNFKELGAELHIYGSGMEEEEIIKITKNEDKNIYFHGVKTASEIKEEIRKFDIGLVPLKNKIHGAFPSKIFELTQLGVPILYVGGGEAAKIIENEEIGFYCEPEDYANLKSIIINFREMKPIEYNRISLNGLFLHKNKFKLEYQLNLLSDFISD
jgi:glycosyltransferase involved in cell wall biosynthesis